MNARSALFDLYGDHLLTRGEQAPVASLVRLLAPLRITAPAVRTAVSRMASQGWLTPVRLPEGAGYRLTPRGVRRLRDAADRIYSRPAGGSGGSPPLTSTAGGSGGSPPLGSTAAAWDGRWHVVVVEPIGERARRDRLRSALGFLGYACMGGSTWISPRQSGELESLLAAEQVRAERFHARYDGDPRELAARAWDLDGLARRYSQWLARAQTDRPPENPAGQGCDNEALFAARSELVHSWRKFLFIDPGLPAELLPKDWPGAVAAEFFDAEAARLMPAAARFVDWCLTGMGGATARRTLALGS